MLCTTAQNTRKLIIILLFHFSCITLFCQDSLKADSTNNSFIKDSLAIVKPKLFRPQLKVDSRASSYEKQGVNIYGYEAGMLFKTKLRLALGYYRMNTALPAEKIINGVNTHISLAINCGHLNTEIMYYSGRYLSLGFPWEFAFGQYRLTYSPVDSLKQPSKASGFLSFTNFGLSLTFTPIRFIGLKGIVGYRKSIYPSEKTFAFNGLFSSIGMNVDIKEVTRDIKMYRLLKKYKRNFRGFETYVDLIAD